MNSDFRSFALSHLTGLMLSALPAFVFAQPVLDEPPETRGIDIIEHPGAPLPADLRFVDDNGDTIRLGDYFTGDTPWILALHYSNCPMLCSLVLNGLATALEGIEFRAGEDFRILTASIDPEETVERSRAVKERYLATLGLPPHNPPRSAGGNEREGDAWTFLTGGATQIDSLADAIGFKYYKVEETGEFAHPAAIYVLTPDGRLSRYLYGIEFKPRDVKFALMEASRGRIGTTIDRVLLYCFHYDPDSNSYTVLAGNVMKLGGGLTLVLLGILLGGLWMRERFRSRQIPNEV